MLPTDLAPELATQIEEFVLPILDTGRASWDRPHTLAVAWYAAEICRAECLDPKILITAACLHDIGYADLFKESSSKQYDNVIAAKELHMQIGAEMAREFLNLPRIRSFYTPQQIARIVHLVSVHDKLEKLRTLDELVLMEADTLGANDLSRVTPTFNKIDGLRYIEAMLKKRGARFVTESGKTFLNRLVPKVLVYYHSLPI